MDILFSNFNLGEGQNTGVNPYLNKSGECREALGCDFREVGSISKHLGYSTYGSGLPASPVLGLYDFRKTTPSTKWLAVGGTAIYSDESGTWTSRKTGLTTGLEASFCTLLDTVIMTNGTDNVQKSTDGVNWSDLGGSPPKARYTLTYDNSIYLLGLSTATSDIRWSDTGTIETWTATNVQSIITNIGVGDYITGGTVNNNSLLIFKNRSTWKWDSYELKTVHPTRGCVAPKSIASIDEWSFWLSHKGIYACNGGKPFRISNKVNDFIKGITDLPSCVGWADDNFYYLYIGTSNGVTNCVIIYDYDNNLCSYKSMPDVITAAGTLTTLGNISNVYLGNDLGQVYKFKDGYSDNNAPIPFKWTSPMIISKAPHLQKDYQYFYVFLSHAAKNGIDVLYSIDQEDFKPLGTAIYPVSELAFPAGTNGHNIRISYETNSTIDQPNILGHLCLGSVIDTRLRDVK